MGGRWPGPVLGNGSRAACRSPCWFACFEVACAPGRRDTQQASPARNPRAHSILRRDVMSA